MSNALFYLMSLGVVGFSLGVILSKNPVMAVLSLLGSFFSLATIYLLAGFEFMAAAQILVYAGAIMVLFLFVIMLLNLGDDTREKIFDAAAIQGRGVGIVAGVTGAFCVASLYAIATTEHPAFNEALNEEGIGGAADLAQAMFIDYALAFEGAGMLLLVTTIAVLVLAKRQRSKQSASEARNEAVRSAEPSPAPSTAEREPALAGGEK